jgi:PTH1 family peptidyl-tRNA hydrolase
VFVVKEPGLIVGLGNPGREYRDTRHNSGFLLAERLAQKWDARWRMEKKFFAEVADATWAGQRLILCRPQTFMNASGEAVGPVAAFYKVPPARVLVLVDDADLAFGSLRLRAGGSSGGHHGLESIEACLGTREYPRLRLGIATVAREGTRELTPHVLGRFRQEEFPVWEQVLERAVRQVETWVSDGTAKAMNLYNGSVI